MSVMAAVSHPEIHVQFFVNTGTSARRRRPTDAVATVAAGLMLVLAVLVSEPTSEAEQAIIDLAAAMPGFLEILWQLMCARCSGSGPPRSCSRRWSVDEGHCSSTWRSGSPWRRCCGGASTTPWELEQVAFRSCSRLQR